MAERSMNKAGLAAAFVLAGLSMAACAGEPEARPAPKAGASSGPRIELRLEPGPHYAKDMRVLWVSYTVWPQAAAWLETPDGRFVDTLYVTELAVTGKYRAAPKAGRPESLPVWTARKSGSAEAVSSPTTVGAPVSYAAGLAASLPPGRYVVMLETNRSYDWNAAYTKKNAGVNGQPSLVYRAELELGAGPSEARFVPIGTGSVDGSDGDIRPGLGGVDTALELFSSLTVRYLND